MTDLTPLTPPETETDLDARITAVLTKNMLEVYNAIQVALNNGEPGFSDVVTGDIASLTGKSERSIASTLGHLIRVGLVWMDNSALEVRNLPNLVYIQTYEHSEELRDEDSSPEDPTKFKHLSHWPKTTSVGAITHVSEERRRQNTDRGLGKGDYPCLICGRLCGDTAKMFHLCGGGDQITAGNPHDDCAGDCLAFYPIGPACYKRHKKALKPFLDSYEEDAPRAYAESTARGVAAEVAAKLERERLWADQATEDPEDEDEFPRDPYDLTRTQVEGNGGKKIDVEVFIHHGSDQASVMISEHLGKIIAHLPRVTGEQAREIAGALAPETSTDQEESPETGLTQQDRGDLLFVLEGAAQAVNDARTAQRLADQARATAENTHQRLSALIERLHEKGSGFGA